MTTPRTLAQVRRDLPLDSTVRYLDMTLRGKVRRPKSVTGTVVAIGPGSNGQVTVRVKLKDGLLDTLPDNLTFVRKHKP